MRAIILAAGIGWRLGGGEGQCPKSLIRFEGRTLLDRHLEILSAHRIDRIAIGVGYQAALIREELDGLRPAARIETVFNPDYRQGNVVTLWHLRDHLRGDEPVILMDADVLYHRDIMARLVASAHPSCFLLDRDYEPGDEPVKLCVRGGELVEFGKKVGALEDYETVGESVGFFKLAPDAASRLADEVEAYVERGDTEAFYEDALRNLLLRDAGAFGYEDVTGLPWIEIDFQEDIRRAEREVIHRIRRFEAA